MRSVASVLACFSLAAHGHRVKTTSDHLQDEAYGELHSSIGPVSLHLNAWYGQKLGSSRPRLRRALVQPGHNYARTGPPATILMKHQAKVGDHIYDSGYSGERESYDDIDKNGLLSRPEDTSLVVASGDEGAAIQNTVAHEVSKQKNEQLALDKVVHELEVDFFRREPSWDIFAEDFTLIEPTGDVVQGLGPIKVLLALLRKMRKVVPPLKADVEVQLALSEHLWQQHFTKGTGHSLRAPKKTVLDVRWVVNLGLELPNAPADSVVEVEGNIYINDYNKVDCIKIDKWVLTGELLKTWPKFRQTAGQTAALNQLKGRAMLLKETSTGFKGGATPKGSQVLIKAASDLVATFISSEIQYVATLSVQAGLLGGASDTMSMLIDGVPVNSSHVGAMALSAGVLSGIFETLWLQVIEREVPGTSIAAVLTKTAANLVIAGTLVNSAYLLFVPILTAALGGVPLGPEHLLDGWTPDHFTSAMHLELETVTPYDLLQFRLVPPEIRPLAMAVVTSVNEIVLSGIMRQ